MRAISSQPPTNTTVVPLEALRSALGQVIADQRREWRRERELIEAQARATVAELRAEVLGLRQQLDQSVADRLASLQDGRSVTVDDVAPLIRAEVDRAVAALPPAERGPPGPGVEPEAVAALVREAVAALPPAEPGPPGTSVTPEDLERLVNLAVERAVAALPPARDGIDADPVETAAMVQAAVDRAVAALPPPEPGRPVDPAEVERMVAEEVRQAVDALPPPEPGRDADPALVAALVEEKVAAAVAAIPPAEPGRSVTIEDVAPLVEAAVGRAVAALPPAEPGRDADPETIRTMVNAAVAALPPPEPGPPGKLPLVRAWADGVHYEADVVTHAGAVYQAQRDTGRAPPHDDWLLIAAAGAPGDEGRSLTIRGTWSAAETYRRLDVVALNGGSFAARRDDPGPCPGEGWQLIASQGKPGKPGVDAKGRPGDPGPPVVAVAIDEQGLLTLVNADGSEVRCDLYPVLAKIGG